MIIDPNKPSHGDPGEMPRVIQATGCSFLNEKRERMFALLALIRHPDPSKRRCVVESTESLAHCAKELDTRMTYEGIYWNGTYRVGTPESIGMGGPIKMPDLHIAN